jgi:hypothetical protein
VVKPSVAGRSTAQNGLAFPSRTQTGDASWNLTVPWASDVAQSRLSSNDKAGFAAAIVCSESVPRWRSRCAPGNKADAAGRKTQQSPKIESHEGLLARQIFAGSNFGLDVARSASGPVKRISGRRDGRPPEDVRVFLNGLLHGRFRKPKLLGQSE